MAKTFDDLRDRRLSHEARLSRLDTLANFMDAAIVVPGTNIRFGADALIGLVPGVGDLATAAISCVIVLEARRMGAPGHLIARMVGNVAIDALAGSVPVIGDLVDVAFRANLRNMRLLRRHFEQTGRI